MASSDVIAGCGPFCESYKELCRAAFPGDERYTGDDMCSLMCRIYERLAECSKKFNLTAVTEYRAVAERHIVDSLMLLSHLERAGMLCDGAELLDIGAGAGFPSLPLAAASAVGRFPSFSVTAVDSTSKKIGYIRESAATLGLGNIRAEAGRAEELAKGPMRGRFDIVTARAVAPLPILTELAAPYLKVGGVFAAMKAHVDEEIKDAARGAAVLGLSRAEKIVYSLPSGDMRTIVLYRAERAAGREYPRQYSRIVHSPL